MSDKYRLAEINLAKALAAGWPNASVEGELILLSDHPDGATGIKIPAYCTDKAALDELTTLHGCTAHVWKGAAWVGNGDDLHMQYQPLDDHPNEEIAMSYASVLALTAVLNGPKKKQHVARLWNQARQA
jgi:hypothetical protein